MIKNELSLLIDKHSDIRTEQTKTRTQETLEFKINRQMETFSLNPPKNLVEETEWLLIVTTFEVRKSVFTSTDEDNSFSITIPGQGSSRTPEKTFDNLLKLLELRSQNDFE